MSRSCQQRTVTRPHRDQRKDDGKQPPATASHSTDANPAHRTGHGPGARLSDAAATLPITSDDGFEWIQQDLASSGFYLEMVKGVSVEELAAMRGADPGLGIMSADTFNTALHRAWNVPDWARLGEHAGWAFALCGGSDGFYMQRPDHVKHLWENRTWLTIEDTTMDPPNIGVIVDGKLDWSYFDGEVHESVRADHPLTQRMIAEIGFGSVDPDPDFPDEPDEWGLHVPDIRDVYRLMGEHYGLSLPRRTIADKELAGVFTSPRVYANGEPNTRYDNIRLP